MWHRILAILTARNREFYRDRAGLGWNVFMPVLMVMGFAFIFGGEPRAQFTIGLLGTETATEGSPVMEIDHVDFVRVDDAARALVKVRRHQLDLLLDLRGAPAYWVNVHSPAGHLAERLVLGAYAPADLTPQRRTVAGQALRYVDWVLPGVLAMNLMFSSLWGVGWVIVRYRKNGVLRRLQATPLSALEFLGAQVLSRLAVVLGANTAVYLGADLLLDFVMRGSYLTLFLVYLVGALCLISLGLIVAARLRTEELADGVLNLMTWPMLLLSGVWFSLEGASPAARFLAQAFPLTHLVDAARSVMIDGAGVVDILPQLVLLSGIALVLLLVAARLFRWD